MRATVCCLFVLICATAALDWYSLVEKELRSLQENEARLDVKRNMEGCYHVADIGLVIDSSRSIHPDDFVKGQTFIADFAGAFTIGPDDVRFAAITFSDGIHTEDAIRFDEYTDRDSLVHALKSIPHRKGGYTATGEGIKYMSHTLMKEARPDVAHFGIVITDGNSQEGRKTAAAAHKAREEGIIMIAIGVGNVNEEELKRIASGPNFILRAESYDDLQSITVQLQDVTCKVLTTPAPQTEPCGLKSPADVYFLYDERQLGAVGVGKVSEFVSIVTELNNFHGMNYGAITVCDSKNGFDLKDWEFKQVAPYFDKSYYTSASTLLHNLNDKAFSEERGHRREARKIAVLFMDGKLDDIDAAKAEAQLALRNDVELYVVNMGGTDEYAKSLVTDTKYLIHNPGGYSAFDLANDFIQRLCAGVQNILDFD